MRDFGARSNSFYVDFVSDRPWCLSLYKKHALFTTYHRHWLDAGPFVDQRFAWVEKLFTIGKPLTQIARIHHLPSFSRDCHGLPKSVWGGCKLERLNDLVDSQPSMFDPVQTTLWRSLTLASQPTLRWGRHRTDRWVLAPYSSCRLICDLFYLSYLGILDPAWRTLPQKVCALQWSNWPHLLPGHRPHSNHCTPRVIISESEVDYLRKLNGNHETIPFKLST